MDRDEAVDFVDDQTNPRRIAILQAMQATHTDQGVISQIFERALRERGHVVVDAKLLSGLLDFAEGQIDTAFDGYDCEGGEIQDRAKDCGLIVETTYSYERHGENSIEAKEGDPWFEYSPEFRAMLGAVK